MRWLTPLLILVFLAGCGRAPAPLVEAAAAQQPRFTMVAGPSPTAAPSPAPSATSAPSATPAPSPTAGPPPLLGGEPAPPMPGALTMVTYSLDLYRSAGGLAAGDVQALGLLAEGAVITGSQRIGGFLTGRVAISFEPPQSGACAIRGITLSNERKIRLFYAPDTDRARVLGILAHELFHQLQHDYYGERDHRKADTIMLEGMAVWGSAPYFPGTSGRPLYHERVKLAQAEGRLLPLTTSLEADCRTTTRNDIYNQWASFVEYLLASYGRDKLDAAYRSSSGRPAGSSDYQSVYGKSLAALEQEWLVWLSAQP